MPMPRHDRGGGIAAARATDPTASVPVGGGKRRLNIGQALLEDRVEDGGLAVEVVIEQPAETPAASAIASTEVAA